MKKEPAHDFPREIGRPATNALLHAGYTKLAQVLKLTDEALLAMHGVGPVAVKRLRAARPSRPKK
ncbi:MAG: DNA-binding protein [Archangium sp.]